MGVDDYHVIVEASMRPGQLRPGNSTGAGSSAFADWLQ